ncbi:transposase [Fusibacter sp. 3D3]|uniref:transposase n=1 Tax=Fusibacter sp. 3D3 TaxID=1048380 RepID=UPI000853A98F|nr:transposase [Fusibacter sp. 3D3]GAU80091.1 hypothetical protein F3D3_4757 [Fusibacter sp. 3D3]
MKPETISHEAYQNFLLEQLNMHYSNGILVLVNKDWALILKLWLTDLSYVSTLLYSSYSPKGPKPRDPASMLRSYLIFLLTRPTIGITEWVDELHRVPLYAILSGFEPGDVPGVGTFYDFFKRLWNSDQPNKKSKLKQKLKRKKKKKKYKKGEKAPLKKPGVVKRLVDRFLKYGSAKKDLPTDRLFDLFQSQFLSISANLGLLGDLESLSIAGDGTPFETQRYQRSKSTCDCFSKGITACNHPRIYSQPDSNSGWDSSREKYFNGYHLYMLSACDSHYDLPLYPSLNPASRHDSISLLITLRDFSQRYTLSPVQRILLDAAHDAKAIYEVLDINDVDAFIDLNPRTKHNFSTDCDISISDKGIPLCPKGLPMKPNGFEEAKNRKKWRCALTKGKCNSCDNPCSDAAYGRTFHTYPKDDLRLFTKTPRDSDTWNHIYKRRTSVERSNKREKVDYHLESGRHRSTKMHSIRLYGIMMCQHIDAWHSHLKKSFNLNELIFA